MDPVAKNGFHRSRLLLLVSKNDIDFEEKRKRLLLALFLCIGIPVFYGFSIIHMTRGNTGNFISDFAVGTALAASLIVLRNLEKGDMIFRINTAILGARLLYLLAIGGSQGSRSLFMFLFPLVAFFLLGKKEGAIWVGAVIVAAAAILLAPLSFIDPFPYLPVFKYRFLAVFCLVSAMAFIFESVRNQVQIAMEAIQRKMETEKEKLAESDRALRYFKSLVEGKTITISNQQG